MTPIFEVVKKVLNKMILYEGYQTAWLSNKWYEIVGVVMCKHSEPFKISNKILYVSVDSPVWNQALFMEKTKIISKINHAYTRNIISDIKAQIGNTKEFNKRNNDKEITVKIDFNKKRNNKYEKTILKILYSKLKKKS